MINIEYFKEKLASEKKKLIEELSKFGRINPDNKDDWEPIAADLNAEQAEMEERAGEITNFEERSAIEFELEKQLNNVDGALVRIENGKFGKCETCGEDVEEARLGINPSATTCRAHME